MDCWNDVLNEMLAGNQGPGGASRGTGRGRRAASSGEGWQVPQWQKHHAGKIPSCVLREKEGRLLSRTEEEVLQG